jgi:KaiC/GvpD/RAD55 family RecA-like ATPase
MTNGRIPSGIYGLDRLIEGGFRDKTANVVVGSSGTGKTTFAIQFIMHGIENGEQGLYISLEESPSQIMEEAALMGFDMEKHYEENLFFIHLKGQNFKKMIEEQLPALVKARSDYLIKTRVVVDPLTPVIWATPDQLEQRELIGKLFYTVKELGVVLATVEEHAKPGETIGEDVLIPVYLSDGVIHLEYYPVGGAFNRTLQIIKMRGTKHGEGVYPYIFVRGAGIVVRSAPTEVEEVKPGDYSEVFDRAIKTAQSMNAPEHVIEKIKKIRDNWQYPYSPEEVLEILFDSFKLKR